MHIVYINLCVSFFEEINVLFCNICMYKNNSNYYNTYTVYCIHTHTLHPYTCDNLSVVSNETVHRTLLTFTFALTSYYCYVLVCEYYNTHNMTCICTKGQNQSKPRPD